MPSHDIISPEELREKQVMQLAFKAGVRAGAPSFAAAATGVFYFFKTNPNFKKRFGFSAMSGFPIMLGIFVSVVAFEQTMYDAHRNPENYDLPPL
jgi:hypothetical protein